MKMRNLKMSAFMLLALCATTMHANAAFVNFSGAVIAPNNPHFANGTVVSLSLDYTPAAIGGGLQAVVNSATLAIGGDSWTALTGASFVTVIDNAGNDNLSVQLAFGGSAGGLGNTVSALNLTITGGVDLGAAPDATEVNVGRLAAFGNAASGTLFLFPQGSTVSFSGTAVPEPSSVFAMGAIGLCVVGGAWRKRKQKQLAA